MKKLFLLCLIAALNLTTSYAQNATIENVRLFSGGRKTGEIMQNNRLFGYYVIIQKEKADKKNRVYEVKTFDVDLKSLETFEIVRPVRSMLTEIVFNGKVFLFQFYDRKVGLEFITYNLKGEKQGQNNISRAEMSIYEIDRIEQGLKQDSENVSAFPYEDQGFIRNTYVKGKKTAYQIARIDNTGKVVWTHDPNLASAEVQISDIIDVNASIITATITRKRNHSTREMDTYCLILNAQTGSVIKEFMMGTDDTGKKSILKSFTHPTTNNVLIIGEYYKPKDDILKDKSQGLYCMELSQNGDELSIHEYAWKGDIDKFKMENVDDEDRKEAEKAFNIFFHDVIVDAKGHIYLIGEQFRKQVSALGAASRLTGGGNSEAGLAEIRIGNMIVFELDENKNLVDFDLIKKRKSTVNLGEGGALSNPTTMAYYLKAQGFFDYVYTAKDREADHFTVVFIDGNRRESGFRQNDLMFGVLDINKGETKVSRNPVNAETWFWWVLPAKPGNITLGQYYRKDKKIEYTIIPFKN